MKKRSAYIIPFVLLLGLVLLTSAKEIPTKAELIHNAIMEKLDRYREREEKKCHQKILDRAGEIVDSTLIARAKMQVKETVTKPEVPFRPIRPEVKLPQDTSPVAPFLNEAEMIEDTLEEERPKLRKKKNN